MHCNATLGGARKAAWAKTSPLGARKCPKSLCWVVCVVGNPSLGKRFGPRLLLWTCVCAGAKPLKMMPKI